MFPILRAEAKSILSRTSGFIAEAGFTHSLTPARNCTFGCTYCYVPTMRVQGGLKPEDWKRWGQFTTFKSNAPSLLEKALRPDQIIYCSPLVDPYQPAEETERMMPRILDCVIQSPPLAFTVQTRGPLILRDLGKLLEVSRRTILRVSFSVTTDREDVRRWYEPFCATFEERIATIRRLRQAGIETYATLSPLLPSNIGHLVTAVIDATGNDLIGDPLHVRSVKRNGATTGDGAWRISKVRSFSEWLDPQFQAEVIQQIKDKAALAGKRFATGPEGFSWLARTH